jgi:hypothetical protein
MCAGKDAGCTDSLGLLCKNPKPKNGMEAIFGPSNRIAVWPRAQGIERKYRRPAPKALVEELKR